MVGASNEEIVRAFASMELKCEGRELTFPDSNRRCIRVALRMQEPHQVVYLARLLSHLSYDEIHFRGAYPWITASGIWNPLEEAVSLKSIEQFRKSYGEMRPLESAPGALFRHDEFVESVCCLLQPMLVGWDAYYVPTWAYGHLDYFIAVSHDGFVDVKVRTEAMHGQAVKILSDHNWIQPLMT